MRPTKRTIDIHMVRGPLFLPLVMAVMFLVSFRAFAAEMDTSKLPPAATRPVDFEKDIKPIFAASCLQCHGPEKQKGGFRLDLKTAALKGGDDYAPAIMAGKSAQSPLIHLVSGMVPDLLMPQKGDPLTSEQIGLLRAWIDQGATWPDDGKVTAPHWSFQAPTRSPVPPTKNSRWVRNPIDSFILAKLEQEKLSPSPETDRRTLIRRLSFDVTGLAPTPEEVQQFLTDRSANAYEALVDRLLASPRYGERWARHWLDVVRFAETTGFEVNTPRNNAWPYRDYVIKALNEDKPYDRFVMEQLAGDALGADEATGFIVGGPNDQVKSPDVVLTRQQRADELHDMVSTTGSAFLGLTVGCARCHNHKFDPISQVDYYAMTAVFSGVQHGERQLPVPDYDDRMKEAKALRQSITAIEGQLTQFEPLADPMRKKVEQANARLNEEHFEPMVTRFVRFTIHETAMHPTLGEIEPCIDELEIFTAGTNPRNVALASNGAKATASGTYPNVPGHKLEHINDGKYGNEHSWLSNEPGTGWVQIEFPDAQRIDKVVWGRDREEKHKDRLATNYIIETGAEPNGGGEIIWKRVAGTLPLRPAVHPRQNVDRFAPVTAKFLRFIVSDTTGVEPCLDELEIYTSGENSRNVALATAGAKASASSVYPNAAIHKLEHINDGLFGNDHSWISSEAGKGWVQIEFPGAVSINKVVWGRDREERYADRLATNYKIEAGTTTNDWKVVAGSNDRRRYVAGKKFTPTYSTIGLSEKETARLNASLAERKQLETKIRELTTFPVVYAGTFAKPETTYRLHRGDPMQRKEEVQPGSIVTFPPKMELSAEATEQQRRLALARWITDPRNPLAARVLVNRIWQHHFGEGIVTTPSDFGINGARPSHPELLDWLATELLRENWSMKAIHRLILLSSTYRQSSAANSKGLAADAGNRLLWRFTPRRLEAEPIRDTILATSGQLNSKMGGPGYDVFEPNDNYVRVYAPRKAFSPTEWRRMIYQFKPRMQQDATFGAFDCPDGGQIAPRRNTSTTPLQALNLFNSHFMMQQAALFAERLEKEAGKKSKAEV
ncbi:MAG: Protein of unknown function (DUF1553)/Protein of unknown function (DUF1549)/Planctomycete, partial [Verrucomicrobiales bacterium]|nr:Protein of unknown function (DUF1553)/Protein of unknown function (DUF1549)/Planctomycete [Verrucomicrobiales bacterium]